MAVFTAISPLDHISGQSGAVGRQSVGNWALTSCHSCVACLCQRHRRTTRPQRRTDKGLTRTGTEYGIWFEPVILNASVSFTAGTISKGEEDGHQLFLHYNAVSCASIMKNTDAFGSSLLLYLNPRTTASRNAGLLTSINMCRLVVKMHYAEQNGNISASEPFL